MIKLMSDKGKCKLEVNGSLSELCADITVLIQEVYGGLDEDMVRPAFKYAIERVVEDGLCFKTNEELKKKFEEEKEKKDEGKTIAEIFEELEKLKDLLVGKKK